jgi:uncharacterized protein (DUF2147 family)
MIRRSLVLTFLLVAGSATSADSRDAIFGRWASDVETSILEIGETDGVLHARIAAMLDPLYKPGEDGPVGTQRVDLHNPDAALRTRPLLGLDLLSEYRYKDGKWQGLLYDPESGKTYKSQITLGSDGKLQMRGYIGMPMLGRTAVWTPVSTCSANVVKMLAMAKLDSRCG